MLRLKSNSSQRWLSQVESNLDEILIDHAHCERKAASTAMGLMNSYAERRELCDEMASIVIEELEHYQMVLDVLDSRGIRFRQLKPSPYGSQLNALIIRTEPQRAVDKLLVASLIEARSCERFDLLRKHAPDKVLADFYDSLFESEARHHATYVRLAEEFAPRAEVQRRLNELSEAEAKIIEVGSELARMHS